MAEAGSVAPPQEEVDISKTLQDEYEGMREEFDFGYVFIGVTLVLIMLYLAGFLGGDSKPPPEPEVEDDRTTPWTLDQIRKYDGKGPDGKIYIACNGFVFDVTKSDNFKEGGMYKSFAGHDISMACAHYSTDEKYLGQTYDPETTQLTFSQEDSLTGFYTNFCQKYRIMGKLVIEAKKNE